jgi:hypothetical protein
MQSSGFKALAYEAVNVTLASILEMRKIAITTAVHILKTVGLIMENGNAI